MVMDESFEFEQHTAQPPPCYPEHPGHPDCKNGNGVPWVQIMPPDAEATIALDPALSMNGFKSMAVHVSKGSAAIANRGNGGAGLFVEASRSYEGYFFAASELGATVRVSLVNRDTNASLGSTTVRVARNGSFTQQHFSLTTTAGAICTDVIRCSGEFRLEVVGPGRVNFDFVFLQPGLSPSKSNKRTNLKKAPTPTCFYWITKRQGLEDLPRRAQDRTKTHLIISLHGIGFRRVYLPIRGVGAVRWPACSQKRRRRPLGDGNQIDSCRRLVRWEFRMVLTRRLGRFVL